MKKRERKKNDTDTLVGIKMEDNGRFKRRMGRKKFFEGKRKGVGKWEIQERIRYTFTRAFSLVTSPLLVISRFYFLGKVRLLLLSLSVVETFVKKASPRAFSL